MSRGATPAVRHWGLGFGRGGGVGLGLLALPGSAVSRRLEGCWRFAQAVVEAPRSWGGSQRRGIRGGLGRVGLVATAVVRRWPGRLLLDAARGRRLLPRDLVSRGGHMCASNRVRSRPPRCDDDAGVDAEFVGRSPNGLHAWLRRNTPNLRRELAGVREHEQLVTHPRRRVRASVVLDCHEAGTARPSVRFRGPPESVGDEGCTGAIRRVLPASAVRLEKVPHAGDARQVPERGSGQSLLARIAGQERQLRPARSMYGPFDWPCDGRGAGRDGCLDGDVVDPSHERGRSDSVLLKIRQQAPDCRGKSSAVARPGFGSGACAHGMKRLSDRAVPWRNSSIGRLSRYPA